MSLALAIWLAAAAPSSVDLGNLPTPLACFGNEPSWSLQIRDAQTVRFKDDLEEVSLRITKVDNAALRPATWRVTFSGKRTRAFIYDEFPKCMDTDSDESYPYGVLLERGEGLLRGCCRPAEP
jgi:uncharacterized membrane protein